ncbi:MAG TPA: family 16 glycoside hydrolase [Sedimentisphaerales bacterium]|nr:family 16 glycoside hydrolase [Sedimentisphaerales bacterium]
MKAKLKSPLVASVSALSILIVVSAAMAKTTVVFDRNANDAATWEFVFKNVPPPSKSDLGAKAAVVIVDGRRDTNGGDVDKLADGIVPTYEDQPARNFFFAPNTDGGRILVDLGGAAAVKQVNTYSWHPNTRGPQVYRLFVGDGKTEGFQPQPKRQTDPLKCGWILLASVDTQANDGTPGGQYAVSISDSTGEIGKFRYFLFDISRTEQADPFGNTFFSEIDIVDPNGPVLPAATRSEPRIETIQTDDGKYRITIDTTETPDLTEWAGRELGPVLRDWYPRIVALLPSEGFEAPKQVNITFSDAMRGVAATGGTRIRCAAAWFRQQLHGEAKGAVVHELVHVVQDYGRSRRNPNATRTPGWLVEGIADYIRWFLFEPETYGAEVTPANIHQARYDASYRVSANFLDWVARQYDKDIVTSLNAAARQGDYSEDLWKKHTERTLQELGDEWKKTLEDRIAAEAEAELKINTLTEEEKTAGWKLLFDGKTFNGWKNFKRNDIGAGWRIKDGALVCADPHNAGDLCTIEQFDWFDLRLDYNISRAANSGIMYHVTDHADSAWATGPEFQLEDNKDASDPVRSGWLYALYEPPTDPTTGRRLDATKPAGRWNQIRLLVAPTGCEHWINGVKYFDYVLASDKFKQRVADSKFRDMSLFAKSTTGCIALQGDHGQASFRNIKIRPIRRDD